MEITSTNVNQYKSASLNIFEQPGLHIYKQLQPGTITEKTGLYVHTQLHSRKAIEDVTTHASGNKSKNNLFDFWVFHKQKIKQSHNVSWALQIRVTLLISVNYMEIQ